MRGIGKRLLALTLCVLMIGAQVFTVFAAPMENCPGECTHRAAIGTTHYDTLQEAIQAAPEGGTVTLLADIADQQALTLDKPIILDLGGKTLTGANTASEALLTATADLTLTNGTLTTGLGACLLAAGCNLVIEEDASLLATEGAMAAIFNSSSAVVMSPQDEPESYTALVRGTLSNENASPAFYIIASGTVAADVTVEDPAHIASAACSAIEMLGSGKLTVTGGTIQAKAHGIVLNIPAGGSITPAVTGGSFTTEADVVSILVEEGVTAPSGFITGGIYNRDPSAYLPATHRALKDASGLYTVVSSFTVTFQAGGGSGSMKALTVNCGDSIQLPKCGFTAPKGKDFAGWKIGTKTYAAGKAYTPSSNVTVTAQWKTHTHSGGTATCEKKPVCETCGEAYGKVHAHTLKHISAYDATCTKSGMSSHEKCTTCGKRFIDGVSLSLKSLTIPAVGHSWETVESIPATCLEAGLMAHEKCADCGALQLDGETVKEADLILPAGEHTLEAVFAVEATCASTGIAAHERCVVCEQFFVNGQPTDIDALTLPVTSHILSDWYSDETEHWKVCVNCNAVFRQKSHSDTDQDGSCNDCGYELAATAPQEAPAPQESGSGLSWLWLILIVIAAGTGAALAVKKRKAQ